MEHPFADFETYSRNYQYMTIPRILDFIRLLNREMGLNLKHSTGLKAEICQRVYAYLLHWRQSNDAGSWIQFKDIYARFERSGQYGAAPAYTPSHYGSSPSAAARPAAPAAYPSYGQHAYAWQNQHASGSVLAAAPPRPTPVIKWKESPLFKIVGTVTEMVYLKESTSANDRQTGTAAFVLSEDVRQRVERSIIHETVPPRLSLRLMCTSSTYYNSNGATTAGLAGLPMEFPQTSEVRVNTALIAANLKGMKKKPGSCPPADLQKGKAGEKRLLKMGEGEQNRVELVHVNSAGPTQVKRFYMQVCLIESTTPDELVSQVKKQPRKSPAEVVSEMKQDAADAEIQIGALTLNLKCPLSYVRMTTPIRSTLCDHLQCFEASSWFIINEQTPQWACPICERVIQVNQLFVDEFSQEIIGLCPDSMDEVLVEPDGLWHSSNKKYGSPAWLAAHPVAAQLSAAGRQSRTATPAASDLDRKGKSKEVFTLSSDDDDDDPAPRPPRANGSAASRRPAPVAMDGPIDLTLSSDDEDAPPAPPPRPAVRSSSSHAAGAGGGGGGDGGSLKRGYSGEYDAPDKRQRYDETDYSSPLPVPTGVSNGASSSASSSVERSQAQLRAQVLASIDRAAPSSALPYQYGGSSNGGLRGGASSSSSSGSRDPRIDHPPAPLPSFRRKDRDDHDDGPGLVVDTSSHPASASYYSPALDRPSSSGRWYPASLSQANAAPYSFPLPHSSPTSASSDALASPPPARSQLSPYGGLHLPAPPSPASLAAFAFSTNGAYYPSGLFGAGPSGKVGYAQRANGRDALWPTLSTGAPAAEYGQELGQGSGLGSYY